MASTSPVAVAAPTSSITQVKESPPDMYRRPVTEQLTSRLAFACIGRVFTKICGEFTSILSEYLRIVTKPLQRAPRAAPGVSCLPADEAAPKLN
jgi:hypothetical protein